MVTMSRRPDPTPKLTSLLADNPDLVDRILDYVCTLVPEMANHARRVEAEQAVREHFGGTETYIRSAAEIRRQQTARQVLQLFNGRNATEVARRLGISRSTVYRCIKQPGQ